MITKDPMHFKSLYQEESNREAYFCTACDAELYAGKTAGTHFTFTL